MKIKRILPFFTALTIGFSGCSYLDMVPENDIETIETIFEKREQAAEWFKSCHSYLQSELASIYADPSYAGADEIVAGEYMRKTFGMSNSYCWDGLFIADGVQMVQTPYADVWKTSQFYTALSYCNIFLDQISKVYNMKDNEKALWVAEIKALKAHYYFELMRRYGPIILVPENVDPNASLAEMKVPRSSIDECVEAIVTLLDEAMEELPLFKDKEVSRRGYYNLEAAAALKAQTLFYAASPLFNGNQMFANFKNKDGKALFPATYDKEKWHTAALAIDHAIELCEQGGKKLVSGNVSAQSRLLNVMKDIESSSLAKDFVNSEAIFMVRPASVSMSFWHNYTQPSIGTSTSEDSYNVNFSNIVGASIKMVEMYYTEHGLPISADKSWPYASRYQMSKETSSAYKNVVMMPDDENLNKDHTNDQGVLGLHLRREPRFYAHIAADRCYWQRGMKAENNTLVRIYRNEPFGTKLNGISDQKQNISGYCIKKGSYSDVSPKEYTNVVEGREEAFVLMRLAELYLMQAEAWNEYYDDPTAHKDKIFEPLNKVRARAGIPDVETSWGSYSNAPNMVTTKEGMRSIIHQEWNVEFAFEGRRFWNLRRWLTAAEELNAPLYGWNILGDSPEQFYRGYIGPKVVWSTRKFTAPRDYLFPIASEEVMISGCVQNPRW